MEKVSWKLTAVRLLSAINLVFVLCILNSRGVYAETTTFQLGDQVTGTLTADGTLTVSGTGAMYDYDSGSSPLYRNSNGITKIVVEDGVTYIGKYAFAYCDGIQQVDIAGSVKTVGGYAFVGDSGIKEVILREGVEKLDYCCFERCAGLETVQLAQSIKEIDIMAFYNCVELRNITLPGQTVTIGLCAFEGCVKIAGVKITDFRLGDQVTGTLTADGTLTVSGTGAMYDYTTSSGFGSTSPVSQNGGIKKVVVEDGVTYIGRYAFADCEEIQQVDIAGSVKTVGNNAFIWDSGIKEVILREGVEKLGYFCFGRCSGLKTVHFAQSIKEIDGSFYGCFELRDVTLPDQLEKIGYDTFGGCVCITELEIPASVRQIDMSIFGACHNIMGDREYSLQNIHVASGNQTYQSINGVVYSKDGKKLVWYPDGRRDNSYTVKEGVEIVGQYALTNEYLETIRLSESVAVIEQRAFSGAHKLKNINLPEALTGIGDCAFEACWMIDDVVVPGKVDLIGYRAFANCLNLHNITILREQVRIQCVTINGGAVSEYIFDGCPADLVVHTSRGSSIDLYMNDYTDGNRVYDLQPRQRLGDINNDGTINAVDKRILYNHLAGTSLLTGDQLQAGDINGDGTINAIDKRMLYNHIAGTAPLW